MTRKILRDLVVLGLLAAVLYFAAGLLRWGGTDNGPHDLSLARAIQNQHASLVREARKRKRHARQQHSSQMAKERSTTPPLICSADICVGEGLQLKPVDMAPSLCANDTGCTEAECCFLAGVEVHGVQG